jgi:superfamily I DNA/RNA helicase
MTSTTEQKEIIFSDGELIYVSARAGTGKTTTLIEYSKFRKKETLLYIVYNKAIRDEALTKFPPNTTIHTIHSLAYEHIGHKYKEKRTNNLKSIDIYQTLEFFKDKSLEDPDTSKLLYEILTLINSYCNFKVRTLDEMTHNELLLSLAKEYWNKMIDLNDNNTLITHDGYLKLFQLSNPVLNFD